MNTNKIDLIKAEVEKLKSQLLRGACSSQIAMETMCKEEAYNEVLAILDSMQEEPVSGLDNGNMPIERWKQAVEAASNQRNYRSSKGLTETRDDYFVDGVQWADEHPKEEPVSDTQSPVVLYGLTGSVGNTKEEPQVKESAEIERDKETCKENGDSLTRETVSEVWHDAQTEQPQAKEKILATNEYGDCEVDFAINMALYWPKVIKWAYIEDLLNLSNVEQTAKNCKEPVSEDLEEASKEWLRPQLDKSYVNYGEVKMMELTHFDGYAMLDAIEFGAKWQKEKEYTCYEEAFEDGATWKVENLWKPADGDDLPEIDREVIAILDNGKVGFAHRPPEYWDGKNIITGKVTRYYPKNYGKGGWNIPDVKFWLDVELPKETEL